MKERGHEESGDMLGKAIGNSRADNNGQENLDQPFTQFLQVRTKEFNASG
jgi:hypothetical protein